VFVLDFFLEIKRQKSASVPRRNDSCKKITDLIFNYLTDGLGPTVEREFERHLRICPDCVNFLNTFKKRLTYTIAACRRAAGQSWRQWLAFLRRKAHQIAVLFFYWTIQATA